MAVAVAHVGRRRPAAARAASRRSFVVIARVERGHRLVGVQVAAPDLAVRSSGLPKHVLRHDEVSAHFSSATHRASSSWQATAGTSRLQRAGVHPGERGGRRERERHGGRERRGGGREAAREGGVGGQRGGGGGRRRAIPIPTTTRRRRCYRLDAARRVPRRRRGARGAATTRARRTRRASERRAGAAAPRVGATAEMHRRGGRRGRRRPWRRYDRALRWRRRLAFFASTSARLGARARGGRSARGSAKARARVRSVARAAEARVRAMARRCARAVVCRGKGRGRVAKRTPAPATWGAASAFWIGDRDAPRVGVAAERSARRVAFSGRSMKKRTRPSRIATGARLHLLVGMTNVCRGPRASVGCSVMICSRRFPNRGARHDGFGTAEIFFHRRRSVRLRKPLGRANAGACQRHPVGRMRSPPLVSPPRRRGARLSTRALVPRVARPAPGSRAVSAEVDEPPRPDALAAPLAVRARARRRGSAPPRRARLRPSCAPPRGVALGALGRRSTTTRSAHDAEGEAAEKAAKAMVPATTSRR